MSDNFDTYLSTLAAEVNALEADRKSGNSSKMVEMGHKLVAIRAALRERYGERKSGVAGVDGKPPDGWAHWVKGNLAIGCKHCTACIRSALTPDAHFAQQRHDNQKASRAGNSAFSRLKHWDGFSDKNKRRIGEFVIAKIMEAQGHV